MDRIVERFYRLAKTWRPKPESPKNDTVSDALSRSLCRMISSQGDVKHRQKNIFTRKGRDAIPAQRRGYVPSA